MVIFAFMLVGAPLLAGWGVYSALHPMDFWQGAVAFIIAFIVGGLVFSGCLIVVLVLLG